MIHDNHGAADAWLFDRLTNYQQLRYDAIAAGLIAAEDADDLLDSDIEELFA